MLEVKNVTKIYRTADVELRALDGVSINLRRNEFVSILGPSGSGKTTLLNIIGGLDHYTSGDLVIEGVSTKDYVDKDWDTYRNHRVGFVFQSYNLISHQSVLSNVELALTLSGVSMSERKKRAQEALKKVGLGDQMNKLPRQLSGGQMQRVAIARALVNNPSIILADEPTGALDSKTSVQIMDLLKEIAKDKLVVMVTHNPELAKQYSTRIINVKDGKIIGDTKPFDGKVEEAEDNSKYTSMSLLTALSLSKNNLMTKRGRTLLTAIAGSIGIIGIALILSLANGVNNYVQNIAQLGSLPSAITIDRSYLESDSSETVVKEDNSKADGDIVAEDDIKMNLNVSKQGKIRYNDTKGLKKYVEENQKEVDAFTDTVHYEYGITLNFVDKDENGKTITINPVKDNNSLAALFSSSSSDNENSVTEDDFFASSVKELISETPYEVLSGRFPENSSELVLVVNPDKKFALSQAYTLNLASRQTLNEFVSNINNGGQLVSGDVGFKYSEVIGKTYRVSLGGEGYDDAKEVKIVGVVMAKKSDDASGFLGYTHGLVEEAVAKSDKYDIDTPKVISFYAKTEDDKKKVNAFIDKYNEGATEKIVYKDQTQELIKTITTVVTMLSFVLVAFVAISLIVSSIMIAIITYISVLERTKEIGILRAIGASKRDVVRVFRAETIIEGAIAGVIGVVFAILIGTAANKIISITAHIDNLLSFDIMQSIILILISIGLTVIAGAVPAARASKKDPVESLRSE
ncbi:ATP-binding cassette domain-containing protein [Candidatus Saccharibacteria bacterium]|nr:ATP-binding cassette domain-containing protein [Candidatus Saccharibacteria bacterium]